MKMKALAKSANKFLSKHTPEIFSGLAIAGVGITVYLTARNAPIAKEVIEDAEFNLEMPEVYDEESGEVVIQDLTEEEQKEIKKNTAIAVTKLYLPIVLSAGCTVACIVASNRISYKRQAALLSIATTSQAALLDYKEKAKEVLGKKKENEVQEEVIKEKVKQIDSAGAIRTGRGDDLCIEAETGQPLYSNINYIWQEWNKLNVKMQQGEQVLLNRWLHKIGLQPSKTIGEHVGWEHEIAYDSIELLIAPAYTMDGQLANYIYYSRDPEWLG